MVKTLEGIYRPGRLVARSIASSHRFGGTEFRLGSSELGHIHSDGTLDIPFTRAVRDALLDDNLAEEHRWVPNCGWTTFHVRSGETSRMLGG